VASVLNLTFGIFLYKLVIHAVVNMRNWTWSPFQNLTDAAAISLESKYNQTKTYRFQSATDTTKQRFHRHFGIKISIQSHKTEYFNLTPTLLQPYSNLTPTKLQPPCLESFSFPVPIGHGSGRRVSRGKLCSQTSCYIPLFRK